ncbi:FxsA [Corynebacterium sp. HMSC05C01]|uniref:FxsA family protein n=1 Tax=Corynebacterium sp. HMSC05C01 TaxID=1581113 RepID=UPI0008A45D74|nr:FxsA family protein [Corynebacterium sp. HMSC05C01]OFT68214.1 FxsA [Corynebacterium sp. HMSC05C01]
MPVLLLSYFVVEAIAFFLVAKWIGVGWALLAIFALMIFGGFAASMSLRSELMQMARGRTSLGKLAGDSALLMAGWALSLVPGFVSSAIGLLLVFGPTRAIARRSMTKRARRSMEDLGARLYEATPMSQFTTSYGSFTNPNQPSPQKGADADDVVIDADELEEWFRNSGNEPGEK